MYINSTHIKIVKLIQSYERITLEDLMEILNLNEFTLRNYLKEIKIYLNIKQSNTSIQEIIKQIYNNNKLIYNLRKNQDFTKQEKIDYLIFNILRNKIVNLSKIAEEIDVNKRTLNYYLLGIKEIFKSYSGVVKSSKNGIFLIMPNYKKARLYYLFLLKLSLEGKFLSYRFRKLLVKFIFSSNIRNVKNYRNIYKEMCLVLSPVFSKYNFITFTCIYSAFSNSSDEKKIVNLDIAQLLKYRPSKINKEDYIKIIKLLKSTPLKHIHPMFLDFIFLNLSHCTYTCQNFPQSIIKKSLDIKPCIQDFLGVENFNNVNYLAIVAPWVQYSFIRDTVKIFDLYYSITGLNLPKSQEVKDTLKKIKLHVPSLSRFDLFIFSYGLRNKKNVINKNKILVYDKIPKRIINIIVDELQVIHNINIYKILNINEFYNFSKNNSIDCIITIENININTPHKIINYNLPI